MSLSFNGVPGVDLSKYKISNAQIAWAPDLRAANELHQAVITHYGGLTARSIWVNAVGQWAVVLITDDGGETAHGTTSAS